MFSIFFVGYYVLRGKTNIVNNNTLVMLQESSISSIQDTGFHENVVSLIWNLLVRKTRPVGILGGAVPVTQSQVSVFHHSWG